MKCKLCGSEKKLIRAHIIPEYFYKELYDTGHSFFAFQEDQNAIKRSLKRKGFYDLNILCKECDAKLGTQFDDYGAAILWGSSHKKIEMIDFVSDIDSRVKWREVRNADAERFKLFLLSILWRASISTLEFFKDVDLGRKHESQIKNFLLGHDLPLLDHYGIIMQHCAIANPETRKLISSIRRYRKNTKTYYAALFNGLMIIWYISENQVPKGLDKFTLTKSNGIKVIFSTKQGMDAIRHFLGENALSHFK